jgi:hypothetical protein
MLMTDDTGWMTSAPIRGAARPSAIQPRRSIGSPRKARCSPRGTVRPVARLGAPRSLPGASPSAQRSRT